MNHRIGNSVVPVLCPARMEQIHGLFLKETEEQDCREFKELQIVSIRPIMPFRYLVSGGVSLRSLIPGLTYGFWCLIEHAIQPWINQMAMFAQIILQRRR